MEEITLVTGATGFIGSHLVDALVKKGRRVRCLVRKTSDAGYLRKLGVELVYGDLLDKGSLKTALTDVSVVYHLAAQVRPQKTFTTLQNFLDIYRMVNTVGTINIADIALAKRISKFIFFSSIAASGPGIDILESFPCRPVTDYGKSKLEAEKYILSLNRDRNFPAIVIRPGQIYGPRCKAMLMLFKLIKHGIFLTIGNGGNRVPLCYVDDLISGVLLAEEKGRIGDIYLIAGKPYTFKEFVRAIAIEGGGRLNKIYFPKRVAYITVALKELFEKVFNIKICPLRADLSKGGIISISSDCYGSIEKARKELGYEPQVDLPKGMEDTIDWFRDNELL